MTQPTVPEDFVRQLAAHHNALLAFITTLVGDYERATDVLQDTYVQIWRMADEFEPGSNFYAWACSVARFKVQEQRASERRDRLIFSDALLDQIAVEAQQQQEIVGDDRQALDDCLNRLSTRQRELIRRRYAAGGTVKQLAAELGRSPQSLAVTLYRIRQTLVDCVQRKVSRGAT